MANIESLSDAAIFLHDELLSEIQVHGGFSDPEVSRLADIITDVFSRFEQEVNGYAEQQSEDGE